MIAATTYGAWRDTRQRAADLLPEGPCDASRVRSVCLRAWASRWQRRFRSCERWAWWRARSLAILGAAAAGRMPSKVRTDADLEALIPSMPEPARRWARRWIAERAAVGQGGPVWSWPGSSGRLAPYAARITLARAGGHAWHLRDVVRSWREISSPGNVPESKPKRRRKQ